MTREEASYLRKIWSRFDTLRANPERYRVRGDHFPGCRLASEGRHVILIRTGPKALEIVGVLRAAMDFKHHLPPQG